MQGRFSNCQRFSHSGPSFGHGGIRYFGIAVVTIATGLRHLAAVMWLIQHCSLSAVPLPQPLGNE
jgi:hypothetical protein